MIYLLMYCASTHGNIARLHIDGPECRPLSAHHCVMGAVVAAVEHCVGNEESYAMTPDEIDCRAHLWIQVVDYK